MTPHDLLANFGTLAEALNGIQRLRELVLELAVCGKLVEQDPAEGMAQNQFPNLCSGRLESDSPKRGRQLKGPDAPEPAPEDLPGNSIWVPIGRFMDLHNGRAFKPNEWATTGLPIIRIQNLNDPSAPFNFCNFEVPEKVHVHDGDLLISWSGTPGTSFGAFIWTRGHAVLNQHIFRVELRHPKLVPEYIRLSVNARLDEMISRAHGGVGLRHITKGELEAIGIPIPPEAEQRRIVARVYELMALLDRLEAKRQEREAARTAARNSALAALREAPTNDDVEVAWLRIQERFGELFATPEDVGPLRQSIHELAVRGRLIGTTQEPGQTRALLNQINAEKAHLVRARKIRASKSLGSVLASARTFEPPVGWEWVPFGELFLEVITGPFGSSLHASDYVKGGTPIVNPQNLQGGAIVPLATAAVAPETVERLSTFKIEKGDILVARRGEMGRCAVATDDEEGWLCGTGSLILRPSSHLSPEYLALFISAPETRARLAGDSVGSTMANLNQRILINLPIALPSHEDQLAIVKAVGQFSEKCREIEEALERMTEVVANFAAAAVHHLDA